MNFVMVVCFVVTVDDVPAHMFRIRADTSQQERGQTGHKGNLVTCWCHRGAKYTWPDLDSHPYEAAK